MKAVIIPSGNPEQLRPLNNWVPEFMLPIVNKPVVEHLIELLVRHHITDIILVLKHMPYETEKYFGNGERWGCNISYSLVRAYSGIHSTLGWVQSRVGDTFLCLPGNVVTNINLTDLVRTHEKINGDVTLATKTEDKVKSGPLGSLFKDTSKKDTFYPFVMTSKALRNLLGSSLAQNMEQMIASLANRGLNVYGHYSLFDYGVINTLDDYLSINRSILKGGLRGIIIPGHQIEPGIWIGRHARIDTDAQIYSPLLIGDHCHIRGRSFIRGETVIGNNVIVSQGVSIQESVILDNTYIGSHTEMRESIIRKNTLLDVPRSLNVHVADDFILGDLEKNVIANKAIRLFNLLSALFLFILFSPLIMLLYCFHRIFPSKRYLTSGLLYGEHEVASLQNTRRPKRIHLYTFQSENRFIRKLPGLINVMKGDIVLVGNSPLTQQEVDSLKEEWEMARFNVPAGLFHLWEVDGNASPTWEEKVVAENYYAATRSFRGDLKILLKSLLPF